MDIREITAIQLKEITIKTFEKNNKELLDTLSKMIEDAVKEGSNVVFTDSLFFGKSSPKGLQNYLMNKGFKVATSINGNLDRFCW